MEDILGIPVIPVVYAKLGYISLNEFLKNNNADRKSFKKKAQEFLKTKVKSDTLYNTINLLWYGSYKIYYFLYFFLSLFIKKQTTIQPESGDVLLFADALWQPIYGKYFWSFIKQLHSKNAFFIPFIYDIIPISDTEFTGHIMTKKFSRSFDNAVKYADHIITISKSEKKIIGDHLKSLDINKNIAHFYLGSDIKKGDGMLIRNSLRNFQGKQYFLVIGTIEPRKNQKFIMDVFEQYIWGKGFGKSLVICGKVGWKMSGLIDRIENSSYLNDKLFMFNNLNDSELDFLYRHAHALIFASEREGFGLPLVEAINKGLPVIVSDIDIFREVGGNYPIYFKLHNKNSLFNAIKELENGEGRNQKESSFKILTWDESVEMLCDILRRVGH